MNRTMRFLPGFAFASMAALVEAAVTTLAPGQATVGDRLTTAFALDAVSIGVTTTRDGRVFLVLERPDGGAARPSSGVAGERVEAPLRRRLPSRGSANRGNARAAKGSGL